MKTNKIYLVVLCTIFFMGSGCIKSKWSLNDGSPSPLADKESVKVDTSEASRNIDVRTKAKVRIFPGLVCDKEPIINITQDFTFNHKFNNALYTEVPQYSTGLYAAPGQWITINVPENVYNLSALIGAWIDELPPSSILPRDPVVRVKYRLLPGANKLRNIYGGNLYLLVDSPSENPVSIKFGNVLKAPDFVLGVSDREKWYDELRTSCVPWFEMRGKNVVFTLPRDLVLDKPDIDPEKMLKGWDDIYEKIISLNALSKDSINDIDKPHLNIPLRMIMDIYPQNGVSHGGIEIVMLKNEAYLNAISEPYNIFPGNANWELLNLIGRNFFSASSPSSWYPTYLGAAMADIVPIYLAESLKDKNSLIWPLGGSSFKRAVQDAVSFATKFELNKSFPSYVNLLPANDARRLGFLLQIVQYLNQNKFHDRQGSGWNFITNLIYKNRHQETALNIKDSIKVEDIYTELCHYTKKNWEFHFRSWGLTTSGILKSKIRAIYPWINKEIWGFDPIGLEGGDSELDFSSARWLQVVYPKEGFIDYQYGVSPETALVDGNLNTKWTSGRPSGAAWDQVPPHTITIIFPEFLPVKGVAIYQHKGGTRGRIKYLSIVGNLSGSGQQVTIGGSIFLADHTERQEILFSQPYRFAKIVLRINATADIYGGGVSASIADVEFLYDK